MVSGMPRPYPKEFKQGAIELARRGERPIAEVAHELGVAESCLWRWLKQDQVDRRERHDGLTSSEREELSELRKEVVPVAVEFSRWRSGDQ
jgi:transposase